MSENKVTKKMTYDICDENYFVPYGKVNIKELENTIDVSETCYFNGKQDGVTGEILFKFEDVGVRMDAYNESWKLLKEHRELTNMLASCDKNITMKEFAKKLDDLGYTDITQYEK